ncbi:FAD-dependent monooxygenase [Halosimplex litoreum]|uniref:FAD-dependent monooxygenase n=1 Tax=Halosimplex litoreum TaxID=1198301 RepID=A0A7U3WBW9_9EURY|nr:FAD-dependent monooxygenase [Halosimplex litoreum]
MTVAGLPRYDPDAVADAGERAVVVGASVAGLLAARVLADGYDEVTVLDSDDLPDEPVTRGGVPQGHHPHALLAGGRATVEDLLPGTSEDVIAGGGVITDFAGEVRFYAEGAYLAPGPTRRETVSASRPLFEHVVREHATAHDRVTVRPNTQCIEYRLDPTGTAVGGLLVRADGDARELDADLVVDATGRASRTPQWLDANGFAAPPVDEVTIDVAYSTTTVERPHDDRRTFLLPASAPRSRGGMAAPVDGDRWVVNVHGVHGETPPTDRAGFAAFADTLPTPDVKRILDEHAWADDVHAYRFPANRRNRYEALDRFPETLVVVGDAVASFNPVYAQGMSVAALEALALHHVLAAGTHALGPRLFDRVSPVVDIAWSLAVGSDFGYPETDGPKPRGTGLVDWYLGRLLRRAHTDGRLTDAFVRVLSMTDAPSTLFAPGIARRVLAPSIRGPPRTADRVGDHREDRRSSS